jgi:class 3 adenylate cyclase
VVDAVRCADEIQRRMAEQNIDVPRDKLIELRIGIHVGDVIIEENDIFGDGVNIAVRLEGIAEPGGISISDDARRIAGDSPQFSTLNARFAPPRLVGSALTIANCVGFSITIASIALLAQLIETAGPQYVFLMLVPGPVLVIAHAPCG